MTGTNLEKIFEMSKFAAMSELMQEEYLAQFMAELDEQSQLRTAHEEGLAAGEAKGRAEGLAEGAAQQARDIALRMRKKGVNPAVISEFTGLSLDEIQAL